MKKTEELKSLSDDELLRRLSDVLKQSRRVESVLVAHIAEVDVRRLFAREASPSMFQYCIDELHLSKAEAYLRIGVARASRRHPMLLTMLGDGRLHLSGIVELAPHLTDANCDELLARATHKTKAAIKELVAEIAPKPDVPSVVRKLPKGKAKSTSQPKNELRPDGVTSPTHAPEAPERPAVVEPLAPSRYKVMFTASGELRDKLERLTALMPGNDLASIVEVAVTEKTRTARSETLRQDEKAEKEPRRRRHVARCARYRRTGEALRVGTRQWSMHICSWGRQTLHRARGAALPSRRTLWRRRRSKRKKCQASLQNSQSLQGGAGLRQGEDGPVPAFTGPCA